MKKIASEVTPKLFRGICRSVEDGGPISYLASPRIDHLFNSMSSNGAVNQIRGWAL